MMSKRSTPTSLEKEGSIKRVAGYRHAFFVQTLKAEPNICFLSDRFDFFFAIGKLGIAAPDDAWPSGVFGGSGHDMNMKLAHLIPDSCYVQLFVGERRCNEL